MVFGIGLGRTGTNSLRTALHHLGYNCLNDPKRMSAAIRKDRLLWRPLLSELVGTYNAFTDYPIWYYYQDLDRSYPRSKFIWTVRDITSWLESRKYMIKHQVERFRRGEIKLPSTSVYNEKDQRKIYLRHHAEVPEYFRGREQDLLVIDIAGGQGWEKLCPFLGTPIPSMAFPHQNKQKGIAKN